MAERPDRLGRQIGQTPDWPDWLGGHMGWEATWAGRPLGLGGHMGWEATWTGRPDWPDWLRCQIG